MAVLWIYAAAIPISIAIIVQVIIKSKKSNNRNHQNTLYVIGDLHGDYDCALYWVQKTNLVINLNKNSKSNPKEWKWNDPTSKLVFMGDYVDKGIQSKQTLEFIMSLTNQFPDHITALLGNHEMQLLKDRYIYANSKQAYFQYPYAVVHPAEYLNFIQDETFETEYSNEYIVEMLYNLSLEVYSYNAHDRVSFHPTAQNSITNLIQDSDIRKIVQQRLESYQQAYIQAFASNTTFGKWLETRPVVHYSHDTLFMHGGLTPKLASFLSSSTTSKQKVIQELNDEFKHYANEETLNNYLETTANGKLIEEFIWYRGNFKDCSSLELYLGNTNISRIAVGHTPDFNIRKLCPNQQLLAVDSSLSRYFRAMGNEYCAGDQKRISTNRRYACPSIEDKCQGQILSIKDSSIVRIIE